MLPCSRGLRSDPSLWLCSSILPQGDFQGIKLFDALLNCLLLVCNVPSGRQGTTRKCVMKQLEPRLRKHSLTSLFQFLMVLQGVGCAWWSSTRSQPALGCHHLALTPRGISFVRTVLSFISLPHSHFSLCPSHGCFHPSQFCHAGDRSRHDMTPPSLLLDSGCLHDPEDQAACVA